MPPGSKDTPRPGVPPEIVSRLDRLLALLKNLPISIPSDPEGSSYIFGLDEEDVQAEGIWYALNRNLEVCFKTFIRGNSDIVFCERGKRVEALVGFLRAAMKRAPDSEREMIRERWVERLIKAAERSGAKIPERSVSLVSRHPPMSY